MARRAECPPDPPFSYLKGCGTPKLVRYEGAELACYPPHQLPSPCFSVVHFVRDPVKVIVSAYFYHNQQPTPEGWVNLPLGRLWGASLCDRVLNAGAHNPERATAGPNGASAHLLGLTGDAFRAARRGCMALPLDPNRTLFQQLRALPPPLGVQLMAFDQILSLLRMAANALLLRADKRPFLDVWMDEAIAEPYAVASRVGQFIARTAVPNEELARRNLTPAAVGDVVGRASESSYAAKQKVPSNSHVTSHRHGHAKEALLEVVENNAALAPLIAKVRGGLGL